MQQLLDNNSLRSLSARLPHLDCPTHLMDQQTKPAVQRRLPPPHSFACLAPKGLPPCLPVLPFTGVKSNKYVGASPTPTWVSSGPFFTADCPAVCLCVSARRSLTVTGWHFNPHETKMNQRFSSLHLKLFSLLKRTKREHLAFKKFEPGVTFRRKYKTLK